MNQEFGSIDKVRFFVSSTDPFKNDNEWIYVLDELPLEGEKVLCHGNKTFCCEIDMEDAKEHEAVFKILESEWEIDEKGNKCNIESFPSFEIDDELCHLIFVSRWKRIKL